ncbi:hypothetical protein Tco_1538437 [Tanacetum coccineum]
MSNHYHPETEWSDVRGPFSHWEDMLRAVYSNWKRLGITHLPLVEFFRLLTTVPYSIKGCSTLWRFVWAQCDHPICWAEVGDSQLTGPEIIHETTEKNSSNQESYPSRPQILKSSYADLRTKKPLGLNPRYIGPFKIIAKVGTVAYHLELPERLSRVHSTFHVSKLKKCMADEPLAIPLDEIQVDDKLHFIEEPVEIMDVRSSV